jgi:hypothetical protein
VLISGWSYKRLARLLLLLESQAIRDSIGRCNPKEGAMEKLGTYSVMEFRAVCKLSNIPATSTGCIALRAKFKRVFAGTGTKREVAHVVALLKQVRKAAESGT